MALLYSQMRRHMINRYIEYICITSSANKVRSLKLILSISLVWVKYFTIRLDDHHIFSTRMNVLPHRLSSRPRIYSIVRYFFKRRLPAHETVYLEIVSVTVGKVFPGTYTVHTDCLSSRPRISASVCYFIHGDSLSSTPRICVGVYFKQDKFFLIKFSLQTVSGNHTDCLSSRPLVCVVVSYFILDGFLLIKIFLQTLTVTVGNMQTKWTHWQFI